MKKEVQMSIKIESELREEFMAATEHHHRPAEQVMHELMRQYIVNSHSPNDLTVQTLKKSQKGQEVFKAVDEKDLFNQLDI